MAAIALLCVLGFLGRATVSSVLRADLRRGAMQDSDYVPSEPVSPWAISGVVFAATMMVMIGIFQAISGLVAIIDDDVTFVVVPSNYTFDYSISTWRAFLRQDLGGGHRHYHCHAERHLELFLDSLLPVLVDPRDRPRCLRDLVARQGGRGREDVVAELVAGAPPISLSGQLTFTAPV
jgi:hypothetical protein